MAYGEWAASEIKDLLEKVKAGRMVLVASDKLGIPTIHDIRGAKHLGFGFFTVKDQSRGIDATFDAGGAMHRTAINGNGWGRISPASTRTTTPRKRSRSSSSAWLRLRLRPSRAHNTGKGCKGVGVEDLPLCRCKAGGQENHHEEVRSG